MLRAIWYLVSLLVLTIWHGGKVIVARLIGLPNRPGGLYDRTARVWSTGLLRAAGVSVRTRGLDRVPRDGPVVYASNHQSFIDILALAATIPGTMRFVSKKELAKVPVFGAAMRSAGHIFIDRQHRQRAFEAYEEAALAVRAGMSAVVFAEGTRSRTGFLLPFKKGPFVFAIAAQVPVIPVYCAGTFTILPKGSMRIRPQPVTLMFGEPIPTAGMDYEDREQLLQQTRAVIEQFKIDAGEAGR
ncbi:MAG: 1-acylglycerol-3-phosphate O-acyltransferase [Gemmatimonadales bacterium]|nr:1-acylglycerol-3-phosphate O-acyltransferase [Gemmatimonadales bacterium]NIN10816.1 1-acylglycerol-3-phosphate O-acyltransferase [Gemmatimonadales bacterium]NIN49459.1 1-acylglycerol-3-phosphate O-acyltransferase [Gemmatimonadales bacterium]NIP06923.1 1-acylglycerol-3-phosphate O-acyltransferase [Gemmatimonadales bacterium]NIR01599.1 1-acylglycerol-3-phosphate O-acyltransferase [Gemmatimonadales bacterium]